MCSLYINYTSISYRKYNMQKSTQTLMVQHGTISLSKHLHITPLRSKSTTLPTPLRPHSCPLLLSAIMKVSILISSTLVSPCLDLYIITIIWCILFAQLLLLNIMLMLMHVMEHGSNLILLTAIQSSVVNIPQFVYSFQS